MRARISHLWRHPIKGHGVEPVEAVTLTAGETMPWDRVWAIAHEGARVVPGSAGWAPCANFSRGAKSPELMVVRARVDEAAGTVTLTHPRRDPLTVNPDLPGDAERLVAWATPLAAPGRAAPCFVLRAHRGMTDSDFPSISILSRASLAALADRVGRPLAMERFRGNVWLEGLAPFAELALVGRELRLGDAVVAVRARITRCKATMVDPATGVSDADTLGELEAGWRHQDFGVYAEVVTGGRVAVGDLALAA